MSEINKNLGHATAYGYAKSKGYTGTEEQFAELMASYADVAEEAEQSATQAAASATAAATSATNAASSASGATQSAQSASASATSASQSATSAGTSATNASTAAQTATTKASEASQSATTAQTQAQNAMTHASNAQTFANNAQTSATQAAASATTANDSANLAVEVAESIPEDYTTLSNDVEDLKNAFSNSVNTSGVIKTESGEPLVIVDGAQYDALGVSVNINATQSGSGTPSPSNVRPITGYEECEITQTLADASTKTYTVDLSSYGKVYGGTLDVTNGSLTVTKHGVDLGTLTWTSATDSIGQYFKSTLPVKGVVSLTQNICSCYAVVNSSSVQDGNIAMGGNGLTIYVRDTRYTTAAALASALSGQIFVYVLATATTHTVTGAAINLVQSYNKFETACGAITASYYALESESMNVPPYWNTAINTAISTVLSHEEVTDAQGESFVFVTDTHWSENAKRSPALIKKIRDNTNAKKIVFGGDVLTLYSTQAEALQVGRSFYKAFADGDMKPYSLFGNHDMNNNQSTYGSTAYLNYPIVYSYMFKSIEGDVKELPKYGDTNGDGNRNLYYYVDNEIQKIRYIFLNNGRARIGNVQTAWLQNKITELASGWTVVVFAHRYWIGTSNGAPALDSVYGTDITDAIDAVYSSASATVACLIVGHCHYDYSITTANGYPVIATTTDCYALSDTTLGETMTLGTDTEQAFDVFSIDTKNRKIYADRVGAGSDREWSY